MIILFSTSSARDALTKRMRPSRSAAPGSRICASIDERASASRCLERSQEAYRKGLLAVLTASLPVLLALHLALHPVGSAVIAADAHVESAPFCQRSYRMAAWISRSHTSSRSASDMAPSISHSHVRSRGRGWNSRARGRKKITALGSLIPAG